MEQPEENKAHEPLPIEPGHVMSREKYQELLEQQS
jgi:hypothetical protein